MTDATETMTDDETALRSEIAQLKAQNERLQADRDFAEGRLQSSAALLDEARRAHRADIETIGDKLIEEADDRGWCSVFDNVVGELNASLNVPLSTRERDYLVTIRPTIVVRVRANSEDGAYSEAGQIASRLENAVDRMDDVSTSSDWDLEDADLDDC